MLSIYLLNYPYFNKHLIPSHRQARAPVILLYFEELREVARRLSKATAYYITADKIERQREREKERETPWKVFCCGVIRLDCCWLQRGTTESSKCRWRLTGLASCVCVHCISVSVCLCMQRPNHWTLIIRHAGRRPRGSKIQPGVKTHRNLFFTIKPPLAGEICLPLWLLTETLSRNNNSNNIFHYVIWLGEKS